MMNSARERTLHPISSLNQRLRHLNEKISDAEDIFERKHRLVEEKLEAIVGKIEEDKRM